MADIDLDKLEAMEKAKDLDRLLSTHIISPGYTHLANLTEVIGPSPEFGRGRCIAMIPIGWSDWIAGIDNAAPELIRRARRLERIEAAAKDAIDAFYTQHPNAETRVSMLVKMRMKRLRDALEGRER